MSNVPLAVAVQPAVIMEPAGMVIVKVPVWPLMVPEIVADPPMYPANRIVPENVLPDCAMVQLVFPIIAGVRPAPIMDPVESDTLPVHVPVSVVDALGLVADGEAPPPHADAASARKPAAAKNFIGPPLTPR